MNAHSSVRVPARTAQLVGETAPYRCDWIDRIDDQIAEILLASKPVNNEVGNEDGNSKHCFARSIAKASDAAYLSKDQEGPTGAAAFSVGKAYDCFGLKLVLDKERPLQSHYYSIKRNSEWCGGCDNKANSKRRRLAVKKQRQ